jgi:hypothetical protein
MENYRPYNNIIESKLQQLPQADVGNLWDGMHTMLDKTMPQRDKKRRFLVWLFSGKSLLICSSITMLSIAACIYFSGASSKTSLQPNAPTYNQAAITTKQTTKKETGANTPVLDNTSAQASFQTGKYKSNAAINGHRKLTAMQKEKAPSTLTNANASLIASLLGTLDAGIKNNRKLNLALPHHDPSFQSGQTRLFYSAVVASETKAQILTGQLARERSRSLNQAIAVNMSFLQSLQKDNDSLVLLRQKIIEKLRNRGAFLGIMAGVDFSTVKLNSFSPGSNKGITLGYAFNKKWCIETGVYRNRKTFSGDSTDFDLKNYSPQPGVKIVSAKGEVQLYEIPFSVRYAVLPNRNPIFITAGISSYFMKWENYKYSYEYNGQSGYSFFSPQNTTENWFSVASFSLGYNYTIGNTASLRIEPYLKMPVKNIGFSNMPVVSTGINIGLTKKLSRL